MWRTRALEWTPQSAAPQSCPATPSLTAPYSVGESLVQEKYGHEGDNGHREEEEDLKDGDHLAGGADYPPERAKCNVFTGGFDSEDEAERSGLALTSFGWKWT